MKPLVFLPFLLCLLLSPTTFPQALSVEVLSAEETHWTTTLNSPGSAGTTSTNCSTTDTNVDCTSTTTAGSPPSSTTVYHTRVDILVKMPDGNEVKMQCHYPPVWAFCFKPSLGVYQARIDKHAVHLLFRFQGSPEYNRDGTIKKTGKVTEEWMKFSFD